MVKKEIICNKCSRLKIYYARELCRQCYKKEPDQVEKQNKYAEQYRIQNKEILRKKEEIRRKNNPEKYFQSIKKHKEKYNKVPKKSKNKNTNNILNKIKKENPAIQEKQTKRDKIIKNIEDIFN